MWGTQWAIPAHGLIYLRTPQCHTTCYKNGCIPNTIDKWNSLDDDDIKNTVSFPGFKIKLNEDIHPCPAFFSAGIRKYNIIYTLSTWE